MGRRRPLFFCTFPVKKKGQKQDEHQEFTAHHNIVWSRQDKHCNSNQETHLYTTSQLKPGCPVCVCVRARKLASESQECVSIKGEEAAVRS